MTWGSEAVYRNEAILNPHGEGWHVDRSRLEGFLRFDLDFAPPCSTDSYAPVARVRYMSEVFLGLKNTQRGARYTTVVEDSA